MHSFRAASRRRFHWHKRAPTEIFFRIYDAVGSCHPEQPACWCTSASPNGMQRVSRPARPARSSNERCPPLSRMQIISVFIASVPEEKDELPANATRRPGLGRVHFLKMALARTDVYIVPRRCYRVSGCTRMQLAVIWSCPCSRTREM